MTWISNWLLNHPYLLERAYLYTEWLLRKLDPMLKRLGYQNLEPIFKIGEIITKGPLFDCRMCGVCNLRGTGMTCPMGCPKNVRNGPCGGVRKDGSCEILPDMICIWVHAWDRAEKMIWYGDRIHVIQPPLDQRLEGSSAWINYLEDQECCAPPGWPDISIPAPHDLLRNRTARN